MSDTPTLTDCPDCEGSGIEPGTYISATWQEPSSAEPCGRCNGTGEWVEVFPFMEHTHEDMEFE